MRLGKKAKDLDYKREIVNGVSRLVCTSRNHVIPLNGEKIFKKFLDLKPNEHL
jgi:hypothetical protein